MLELIDSTNIGKSVNLIYSYRKHLLKCIEEKLWIHHAQKWWSPYEFAVEFGRSWLLAFDENTELKNPYHIIQIDTKTNMSNDYLNGYHLNKAFKHKVDAYYKEGWDLRLKLSIETNKWV